jgi:hypothetical protein
MTLEELLQEVYNLTDRPELVALSKTAIKSATLKGHMSDFYYRDIYEIGVQLSEPTYIYSFIPYDIISNFRAPAYIKRVADENDEQGKAFDPITPDDVLDAYKCLRSDVYYSAGRTLEIRSSVEFSKMLVGAYVLPIVTDEGFSSWIAELVPYYIIYEAAAKVFKAIGQDQEAAFFKAEISEQFITLRTAGLTQQGY